MDSSAVLIDQGISSVSNLAALALAATTLSAEDFGAVSVAFAAYSATVVLGRGAVGEVILVQRDTDPVRAPLGAATLLGVVPGLVVVLVGLVLGGPLSDALVPLGLLLPLLFLQDTARYVAVAQNRRWVAVANDGIWLVFGVGFLLAARAVGLTTVTAVAAWAVSGALGAVVACGLLRGLPDLRGAAGFFRRNRLLWPTMMADSFITGGARALAVIAIAAAIGLAESGGLRVAQVTMGPITVLVLALPLAVLPRLRSQAETSPGVAVRTAGLVGVALAVVAGAWTLVLVQVPDSVGERLLGSSWPMAAAILVPIGLYQVVTAFSAALQSGFRALHRPRSVLQVRVVTAPGLVVLPALAGLAFGVNAAVLTLVGVELVVLVVLVVRLRQLTRSTSGDPTADGSADAVAHHPAHQE